MKNIEVKVMLQALVEVMEFKSSDLDFIRKMIKNKKALESKFEELKEILEQAVKFTDDEKAVMEVIRSGGDYDKKSKEVKGLEKKNKLYFKKHNELMDQDCDLKLESLEMDKFPDGVSIKHYDALNSILT